jgi:hypothetical protein
VPRATVWVLALVLGACGPAGGVSPTQTAPAETLRPPPGFEHFDSSQRTHLDGFSVLPPTGANWFVKRVVQGPRTDVLYGKTLRSQTPKRPEDAATAVVAIFTFALPEDVPAAQREGALAFLSQRDQADSNVGRFSAVDVRVDARATPTTHCYWLEGVVEDRGVPEFQGAVFLLQRRGFKCFHPSRPLLLGVEYSQRTFKGQPFISLDGEIAHVLTSIEFDR